MGEAPGSGGVVIGGNLGREGHTEGGTWAVDLREAVSTRPEIRKPIWQVSLRTAPGDRKLSDGQWRDAATIMAERMGYEDHPWVMVRHGEDHVHIVVSRVSDTGQVWHARQDFRAAQRAATALEKHFDLIQAPRQKAPGKARSSQSVVIGDQQQSAVKLGERRAEEATEFARHKRFIAADLAAQRPSRRPTKPTRTAPGQTPVSRPPVRDQRTERGFER